MFGGVQPSRLMTTDLSISGDCVPGYSKYWLLAKASGRAEFSQISDKTSSAKESGKTSSANKPSAANFSRHKLRCISYILNDKMTK